MKISLNWLKDFINIPENISPQKIGELLTLHTAEVEAVIDQGAQFANMYLAQVVKINPHPNADKLKIVEVDLGAEKLDVVCGGNNLRAGMLVPFAKTGAKIRWHGQGDLMTLEKAVIRGVESNGMICAGKEIGLPAAPQGGITDLSHLKKIKPGTKLAEALNLNDVIFDIDNKSLTHRPDLWGHYGIARELSAILGVKLKPYKINANAGTRHGAFLPTDHPLSIAVQSPSLCPRYCGVMIDNIKIKESPEWLKRRLQAVGYRSICNIVDVTNYVMAELGQPLHAFDKNYIQGGIIVRNAKEGEVMKTLDGNERKLTAEMLVIADHEKPVALAGIMGGENSEINVNTQTIIIESANFEPVSVRKTSVKLGLRTESVQRFEKSLDPNLARQTICKAIALILKLCPKAQVVSEIIDIKNFSDKNIQVDLKLDRVNSKIGKEIPLAKVKSILKSLAFQVTKGQEKKTLHVIVPAFRATKDINIEDDLVEEVARLYGYENIEPILPDLPIKLPIENRERLLKHQAREILSLGLGMTEAYNYYFYSQDDFRKCGLEEKKHIKVENYLSADQTHLRVSLVPNLLKAISKNLSHQPEFKIYEIGRAFEEVGTFMPKEEKIICAAIIKDKSYDSAVFLDIKEYLQEFLQRFKYRKFSLEKSESPLPYAHPAQSLDIIIHGQKVGTVFTLHPVVAGQYDLSQKIGFFELNFSKLTKLSPSPLQFKSLPKFPGLSFDISVLVDEVKTVQEIKQIILQSYPDLISEITLFDIYRGQNLPPRKKALAFNILLLNQERTLSEQDLRSAQNKIFANLQTSGGEIRGLK